MSRRSTALTMFAVVLALWAWAPAAAAQDASPFRLAVTLESPAPREEGWFGNSLAMDTDRIIVGEAFGDAGRVRRAGRSHLFTGAGELLRSYQSPSPRTEGAFGGEDYCNKLVAVVGGRCCVGESRAMGGGKAHLFGEDGNLIVSLRPAGNSLAMTDGFLLVGSYNVAANLYDLSGNLVSPLKGPGGAVQNGYGMAVSIRGDTVVVTQDHATVGGVQDAGMAHLYDTRGSFLRSLQAPDPQQAQLFGVSASTDGQIIVVGAPEATVQGRSGAGLAYVFDSRGELKSVLSAPIPTLHFGVSVAVGRDFILVGAAGTKSGTLNGAGAAFLFGRDGALRSTLRSPTPTAGANFGWSVAAADARFAISAPSEEAGGTSGAGRVYVFEAQ